MKTEIGQRIYDLLAVKNGGNQSELARFIPVSPQAVQQWVEDEAPTTPRGKNLNRAAEFFGVTPRDLQFGGPSVDAMFGRAVVLQKDVRDVIEIPLLDVEASMGPGAILPDYEELVEKITVTREWLRRNVMATNPTNLQLITGYGDSMDGTFSDGDVLLVDRGITEIKMDAVYVLSLNDELYIKRLQRRPDGSVLMISDNKKYEPYLIQNGERSKFQVLGRVVLVWNAHKM